MQPCTRLSVYLRYAEDGKCTLKISTDDASDDRRTDTGGQVVIWSSGIEAIVVLGLVYPGDVVEVSLIGITRSE